MTPLERSPQVQRPIRPGVHLHDDTPTPFHVHMRSFLFPRLHHDACKPSSCAHDRARSRTMRVRERPRPRLAIAMFKVVKFNVINFIVTASDLGRVRMCHGLRRCGTLGLHVHFEPLEHRAHVRALCCALHAAPNTHCPPAHAPSLSLSLACSAHPQEPGTAFLWGWVRNSARIARDGA